MKNILYKQGLVLAIITLLFGTFFSVSPVYGINVNIKKVQSQITIGSKNDILLDLHNKDIFNQGTSGSEYWALLFAVGIYKNHPEKNRPSMLEAVEDLYDVLLDSPQWQADHIHKVTGSDCLLSRLLQELNWLSQNAGEEDMVIVYLTTHGSPLHDANGNPLDLPPKDEADGADEILAMYDSFDKDFGFIWDDLLNFYLNKIKSMGLCLIVDSCYSGGFNDISSEDINFNSLHISQKIIEEENIYYNENNAFSHRTASIGEIDSEIITTITNIKSNFYSDKLKSNKFTNKIKDLEAYKFTQDFIEDVRGQGRIILMSTEEDSLSWGSDFSNFLIIGFEGFADVFGNGDGINSAEESFDYADWWVYVISGGRQNPTIVDNYVGEFTVTYV